MMQTEFSISKFDDWCGGVAGLSRVADYHWANFSPADISYPDSDLAALADIEPHSFWFAHRSAVISNIISQHPPAGAIFDIGGGNGFVSLALASAGLSCVVVEPDHSGALTARRRGLPVIEAAFQNLAVVPGSLPAAGLFDVLEHIEDDMHALVRLRLSLVPGGMIYITVPAFHALWSNEDVEAGHFRRYTRAHLLEILRAAGFMPLRATYFFSTLVPAIFLMRSIPGLFQKQKTSTANIAAQHTLPSGWAGKLLQHSFRRELAKIASGRDIAFGSSVLVVAKAVE